MVSDMDSTMISFECIDEIADFANLKDEVSEITEQAKAMNAGLIVISSHGRTGVPRFLMGSVAERVVRLAPCPVLVLREPHAE